jgi:hypothetical protein
MDITGALLSYAEKVNYIKSHHKDENSKNLSIEQIIEKFLWL